MQKLRAMSRRIINDPIYEKVDQTRYRNHLQAIKKPYTQSLHQSIKNSFSSQSQQYFLNVYRYKKTRLVQDQNVDPVLLQNRSLIRKMYEIDKRKTQSLASLRVASTTSKHKLFMQKVKSQNKFIFDKIKNERQNILTKKDIKKQCAEADKLVMHSRRIKQTIKKSRKNKSLLKLKFTKQYKNFDLNFNRTNQVIEPLDLK